MSDNSLLIFCSWHQTTKPRILFSANSTNIFQLEQLKKKTNFLLVQNRLFLSFGPMKSLFSFSTAQTEKILWKKLGKTRLVVWWFDVTNKIQTIVLQKWTLMRRALSRFLFSKLWMEVLVKGSLVLCWYCFGSYPTGW